MLRRPLPNGGLISTHEDVTERKLADAQIAHIALHDPLTGLSNRTQFNAELERASKRACDGYKVALLCLDLDQFKKINDALGHPIGDFSADRRRSTDQGLRAGK